MQRTSNNAGAFVKRYNPEILTIMCLKKIFFSTLLTFGFVMPLMAQYQPGRLANGITPTISLPSTEAASLGKYGEWPVSLYTGTASVTVPIYEIKIGSFSLPVQLSYHTGGVKVDDVASWTGVNWTLSAGGAITRAIIGMEDEDQPNGFLYRNQHGLPLKTSYNLQNSDDDYVFIRKVARNEMDTEPDKFYYNFAGQSGSFYFDAAGKMRCMPANTLKLLRTPVNTIGGISQNDKTWELADAQGNVYTFGGTEGGNGLEDSKTFTVNTQSAIELPKTTAYYLTRIVLNNRLDTVYFDYVQKTEMYELPYTYSYKKVMTGIGWFGSSVNSDLYANQILQNGEPGGYVRARMAAGGLSMLRKIRWSGGEVVFNATQARQDIYFGMNLTSVAVFNKKQQKIKETLLTYDYINQRYFLTKVSEGGNSATDSVVHKFEYYSPSTLPARFSNAQDHWGYFNGAYENTHLLPPHQEQMGVVALDANREPNESYMMYGALKTVTYPTGGSSEFVYEGNRYAAGGIPGGGNPPGQLVTVLASATTYYPQANTSEQVLNFSVPAAQTATNALVEFKNYGRPSPPSQSFWPKARVEKLVGQTYQTVYAWDAHNNFPSSGYTQNPNGTVSFNVLPTLTFDIGEYRIITEMPCGGIDCDPLPVMPSVKVSFNYKKYVQPPTGPLADPVAGGLRIKELVSMVNGEIVGKKRYTYGVGNILIYPSYFHEYGADEFLKTLCGRDPECEVICPRADVTYREVISSGTTIMGLTQGSPVGYPYVREAQVSAANVENGYSTSNFSFIPDTLNELTYDPSMWSATLIVNKSIPPNGSDYKRGLLLKKEEYNAAGIRLHSVENEYEFNDGNAVNNYNRIRGMRVTRMFIIDYQCGYVYDGVMMPEGSQRPKDYGYGFYSLASSWLQTKKTIETTWDENGANPVVSETLFSYANPSHMQVTSMQTGDSKGNTVKYDVKYPSDFASTGTPNVYNKMLDRNLVGAAVEETKSITAPGIKPLSQQRVNYANWQNDKVIAPATVQSVTGITVLNIGDASQIDAKIHSYDAVGRATAFEGRDQLVTSIIWGVERNTPLAKIVNAPASAVAYTSFEDGEWGGWAVPAAANTDATALTGNMSYGLASGAIIKAGLSSGAKYKVSYWTKNTSPYTVTGTQGAAIKGDTHRGWTRFEHEVTGQTSVTVSGSGSIDHLIICPEKALAETYTAIPLIGITSKMSPDGKIVYYEYDALGRMKVVKDQDGAVLNMFDYKYQVSVP